ncbi:MAG TPA: hypothetical protein VGM90_07030 [Kofleriaceae bacterium]|jgi:hypothetical protein
MTEEDLTLRLLRDMRASIDELSRTMDKRFDAVDARLSHNDVEIRSLKATSNKNTVLLEATIEMVAQLRASRTVTDVSIRHHESELEEIRERLARLEEKT